MENKFQSNHKIGDIVNSFPGVADIFKEYKIDFCCGGDRLLKTAINEQGLNETEVLNKINKSYQEKSANSLDKDWTKAKLDELVDHILINHHAYLYTNLPIISELTTKILRVHGQNHPELTKVHKLFHSIKMELESHLIKEETIQYPAIKKYLETKNIVDLKEAIEIINALEEEHTGAGDILKELQVITNDYSVPDDGCGTYRKTYEKLLEMQNDLFQHIHLENNILFPRLRSLIIE